MWHLIYERPFDDSTPAAGVGMGLLGAAAGITTAHLLTPNGIEQGRASALNSGPVWGFFLGYTASRANYGIRNRGRLAVAMGTQFAGLGAGELIWRLWEPTRGQVWVADSTALWAVMIGTGVLLAVDGPSFPPERPILAGTHFWTATLGLVGGSMLAAYLPQMTAGRMAFINLAGASGALGVGFIAVVATAGTLSPTAAWGSAIGGAIGGLAAGAWITRNMGENRTATALVDSLSLGFAPLPDGGRTITLGGRF